MSIKGFYIYREEGIGVRKKIESQTVVLKEYFEVTSIVLKKKKQGIGKKIFNALPGGSWPLEYKDGFEQLINPDFVYIRKCLFDREHLKFLKKIKKTYPDTLVVYEIPTYPYLKELSSNLLMMPWACKDFFYRKKLKKYVNCVVVFSRDEIVFNIPTIQIRNGVCIDAVQKNNFGEWKKEELNLIAVGELQPYHGYERLLYALGNYYRNRHNITIYLHIVGDGRELVKYKRIIDEFDIHDYVICYGKKEKKELDEVYDKADIAVGSLALYKEHIEFASSLKTREYLLKGLPIISACQEDVFENKQLDFNLRVPNNNSLIDLDGVIEFYNKLCEKYQDKNRLTNFIHDFAVENVDIHTTFKPVVDYIISKKKAEK